MAENPFRLGDLPEPPHFVRRPESTTRIRNVLLSSPAKLLVHGAPRVGKSWTLAMARVAAKARGGSVILADLSTVSTVADVADRLLAAAARAFETTWSGAVEEMADRLGLAVRLVPHPLSGALEPLLEPSLRGRSVEDQWTVLEQMVGTIDRMASRGNRSLGVILDGVEPLLRVGGAEAAIRLRKVVEAHRNLSFVLGAGGRETVRTLTGRGGAFHRFLGLLAVEPVEKERLAEWIDERMESAASPIPGLGRMCCEAAGPRTGDAIRLARACFCEAEAGDSDPAELVGRGFQRCVDEQDTPFRAFWLGLTPYQQNVLRAVAGAESGLTTAETLGRFSLGHSGSAANAARALVKDGRLVRTQGASGYDFDGPFLRGWVIRNALPDVGIHRPLIRA